MLNTEAFSFNQALLKAVDKDKANCFYAVLRGMRVYRLKQNTIGVPFSVFTNR